MAISRVWAEDDLRRERSEGESELTNEGKKSSHPSNNRFNGQSLVVRSLRGYISDAILDSILRFYAFKVFSPLLARSLFRLFKPSAAIMFIYDSQQ